MNLTTVTKFVEEIANTTRDSENRLLDNAIETYRHFGNNTFSQLITVLEDSEVDPKVVSVLEGLGLGDKLSPAEKLTVLKNFTESVLSQESTLRSLIDDIPKHMTDKTMSLKTATVLEIVNDLNTIGSFLTDITLSVTFALSGQDYFNSKRLSKFTKSKYYFKILFLEYKNNLASKLKEVTQLSEMEVKNMTSGDMTKEDKNFTLPMNGFVGNPIYHIRKGWVDLEIWRINRLKVKKQLFEAKMIELRTRESKGEIKDASKQVDYYQKQVETIEYKIDKLSKV
ncbi:MAG: hypothetical protein DRP93_03115 [Candidatus Neomarinimicrobiota bacterium]|nr:MAG: hypothetical protein DRP93_03115 [Candidatus Neomarinimicrobiota bacterium]